MSVETQEHPVSHVNMKNGIIDLDTPRGNILGFTSDKYDGYLWKIDGAIIISFIVSKQKGNFRELVNRILGKGWAVHVPTPLGQMKAILVKNGYKKTIVEDEDVGPVETWVLQTDETPSLAIAREDSKKGDL